ncbi:hypothetical protein [Fodinibius halophilus]|uniref:Magnesium chelatase n=1 Tax=Fodinibius halophilus TaxID=1736908 RepID=A0A6M1T779_9BACT|nr:hypothetical protein [Fodinibius halophilus]NGP89969.1 hypothetical protein [Fodinibius halophilus]
MQNQAVILNVMKDFPFNGSRWILEILRQAQNDEINGFAKPSIMQERDIQIRGFKVRIPMDVLMVFSANPEDYTNRGNIITPLKDRIDAQILTHYPREIDVGMEITEQEAWTSREDDLEVSIPALFKRLLEEISFKARSSEYIDQKSGVSTRLTITAMEQLISSAERRALINGETKTVARITDVYHIVPALTGKLELVYEGEQEGIINVSKHIIGTAIKKIFTRYFPDPEQQKKKNTDSAYKPILNWFAEGNTLEITDQQSQQQYEESLKQVPGLQDLVREYTDTPDVETEFTFMDFVIEALHQHSILGKEEIHNKRSYSDMLSSMLSSMDDLDNLDDFE